MTPRGTARFLSQRTWPALLAALLAGACAQPPATAASGSGDIGILVFGDSGYDYPFLDRDDLEEVLTPEQFVAAERADWIEDRRPAEDFTPPPYHVLPQTGGAVNASGLEPVARAMHDFCADANRCNFAFMLGDNIYPSGATLGSDGIADAQRYEGLFMRPYRELGGADPDFRIYAVLGNHDWYTSRAGAMSQVAFLAANPPFFMDGIRYRVQPPAGRGEVEIFALDTYVMLAGTDLRKDRLKPDGTPLEHDTPDEFDDWVRPANELERGMAQWLESSLRESNARWKIVIGHHPLWSSGGSKFEEAAMLRRLILPALCRYADAYFAGHDHSLEVHTDDCSTVGPRRGTAPLLQVVSGAAAKQRGVNRAFADWQARSYPQHEPLFARGMTWGFVHVTLGRDSGEVTVHTTPNDGTGTHEEVFRHRFQRRSGAHD